MSRSSQVRPSLKRSQSEVTRCHHDADDIKRQRGITKRIMIRRPSTAPDFTTLLGSGSRPLPFVADEPPLSPPNESVDGCGSPLLEEELVSGTIISLDQAITLPRPLPTPDASQGDFYPFAPASTAKRSNSKRRRGSSIIVDDAFEDEWPGYTVHPTGLLFEEDVEPHYFSSKSTKPLLPLQTKHRRGSLSPSESRAGAFTPDHLSTSPRRNAGIVELEASMTNLGISIPTWNDPFVVMATTSESKKSPVGETAPRVRAREVTRHVDVPRRRPGTDEPASSPPATWVKAPKPHEMTSYFPPMESPPLTLLDSRSATPRPRLTPSHFSSGPESIDSLAPASWSSSQGSDIIETPLSPPRYHQAQRKENEGNSAVCPLQSNSLQVFEDDLLTRWARGSA